MKNKVNLFLVGLFISTPTFAITVENDLYDFNTYGSVGDDFGSNFNYYYDKDTKIVSRNSVKPYDETFRASLDSAYVDRSINKSLKVRVGRLPLIDSVDYKKIGEDIKTIAIDDKVNSYDGLNISYKESTPVGDLYFNNIMGRFKTTRDEESYYDNVVGGSVSLKLDDYKFRIGHTLIQPNFSSPQSDTDDSHTKGVISSVEFDYVVNHIKHSNEYVQKNYYNDDKTINAVRSNISYIGLLKLKPFTEFQQEMDQWNNGQRIFSGGLQYSVFKNVEIRSDYKKIYRTYSDGQYLNQQSSNESLISLGLTVKY